MNIYEYAKVWIMHGPMRTYMSFPLANKSFVFSAQKRPMTQINPEDELISFFQKLN
jgi:hypothetical protein